MQPLLPLIERLALFPAETLLAIPAPPDETLRGLLVLRGLAGQLGQEARALREEQARVALASQAVEAEMPRLAAALAKQQAEAAALDGRMAVTAANRRQAEDAAAAAAQRAAANAARAETLREMLAALENQPRTRQGQGEVRRTGVRKHVEVATVEAAVSRAAPPRGQFFVPVAGAVVRSWGETTEGGPAMGITYQPPPAARVLAPCTGRVAFAARFRSYGLLLIVDCGAGYHAVLAGFARIDVKVAQELTAGEPVGVMPNWEPGVSGTRPGLYVELRRDGQPMNPAPWLRARG
jgi:murein hydrolase activator